MKKIIYSTHQIATFWDNDMNDEIEEPVRKFMDDDYPTFTIKKLSGFSRRDKIEILESLEESTVILINSEFFGDQLEETIKWLAHNIHVNQNGATRNYKVSCFVCLSTHPFEAIKEVVKRLHSQKDFHNENPLNKILFNVGVYFSNPFAGELYELKSNGSDYYTIRHN